MLWVSNICHPILNIILLLLLFLVLHPKHKLKYFERQGWDKEWIATAEEIVQEEFRKNYAAYVIQKKEKKIEHLKKVIQSELIN